MRTPGPMRQVRLVLAFALIATAAVPAAAHAAVFTVDDFTDTGGPTCISPCTLRQAINASNATPAADDEIKFSGAGSITPATQLPDITDTVTIDGRIGGAPAILLDGTTINAFEGLLFKGAGTNGVVRGMAIVNFNSAGIDVREGANATIQGCRLGLTLNDVAAGNSFDGVQVHDNAAGATIGGTGAGEGNVISANGGDGIFVQAGAPPVAIVGNRIGTNAAGTAAVGSQPNGVVIDGNNQVVGGAGAGQGNLIAGNTNGGVFIANAGATGNSVEGNVIGLAADGQTHLGNASGVLLGPDAPGNRVGGSSPGQGNVIAANVVNVNVAGDSSRVEGNVLGLDQAGAASGSVIGVNVDTAADGTIIGGSTEGARNVLSGNSAGIQTGGPNTKVLGNYIGLAADGLAFAGNSTSGVIVQQGADGSQVGGPGPGEGNLIAGNNAAGIVIRNSPSGVLVRGNGIGVNKNGEARRNLTAGVRIFDAAGNTVGGPSAADANTIAFNGSQGVDIDLTDPAGANFEQPVGNQVMRNSIHDNGGLGIDLSAQLFGRTANDPGDGDTGANDLQNFPVLTTAYDGGASTAVSGTLSSRPNQPYRLRFWSNPAGFDQADTFLGDQEVTTNGAGDAPFTFTASPAVALGRTITATATDVSGNTSEISDPVVVQTTPPPPPTAVDPHKGVLGFRTTSFRSTKTTISFKVTNRVDFDFVVRITGREGEVRSARAPAFKTVRATVKAGKARTIKLKIPSAQRKAITRALKKRKRIVRRPSIRVANVTTGTSRQYKPRLIVKR